MQEVKALVRLASLEKEDTLALKARGVTIVPADFTGPVEELTKLLVGTDIVLCTIFSEAVAEQINLATAASAAKVGRFVASWWGPVAPPRGLLSMRDLVCR